VSDDSVTLRIEVTTDQFALAMKALGAHAEMSINTASRFRSGMGAFRRTVAATRAELAFLTAFRYEAMPNWWIYDETDVTILDEEMPEELRPDDASGRDGQNDAAGETT